MNDLWSEMAALTARARAFSDWVHPIAQRGRAKDRAELEGRETTADPREARARYERLLGANEELRLAFQHTVENLRLAETAKRRHEELCRIVPGAHFVTDRDGVIRSANHRAAALLRMEPRGFHGKKLQSFLLREDATAFQAALAAARQGPVDVVLRFETRNGSMASSRVVSSPTSASDRILWCVEAQRPMAVSPAREDDELFAELRDLEARTALERSARERAEEKCEAGDRRIGALVREIRATIVELGNVFTELSSGQIDHRAFFGRLRGLSDVAKEHLDLVDLASDLARAGRGELVMQRTRVDVSVMAPAIVGSLEGLARDRNVLLGVQVDGDVLAHADPRRLTQILQILVTAAVERAPEDGCVAIRGTRVRRKVHVTITETGDGVPADALSSFFEKWRGRTDVQGLRSHIETCLVRHLVELHGGDLIVSSARSHRGTSIGVKLPAFSDADATVIDGGSEPDSER